MDDLLDEDFKEPTQTLPKQSQSSKASLKREKTKGKAEKVPLFKPKPQKFRFPDQNDFLEGENGPNEDEGESTQKSNLIQAKKASNQPVETISFALEQVTNSSGVTKSIYCFSESEMHIPLKYSKLLKNPGKEDADIETDDEQMGLAINKVYYDLKEAIDMHQNSHNQRFGRPKSNFHLNLGGHWKSLQEKRLNNFKSIPMNHLHHRANTMRSSFVNEKGTMSYECSTQVSPKRPQTSLFQAQNKQISHEKPSGRFSLNPRIKESGRNFNEAGRDNNKGIHRENKTDSMSTSGSLLVPLKSFGNGSNTRGFSKELGFKGNQRQKPNPFYQRQTSLYCRMAPPVLFGPLLNERAAANCNW